MLWDIAKFFGRALIGFVLLCIAWELIYQGIAVMESFFGVDLSLARALMEPVREFMHAIVQWVVEHVRWLDEHFPLSNPQILT